MDEERQYYKGLIFSDEGILENKMFFELISSDYNNKKEIALEIQRKRIDYSAFKFIYYSPKLYGDELEIKTNKDGLYEYPAFICSFIINKQLHIAVFSPHLPLSYEIVQNIWTKLHNENNKEFIYYHVDFNKLMKKLENINLQIKMNRITFQIFNEINISRLTIYGKDPIQTKMYHNIINQIGIIPRSAKMIYLEDKTNNYSISLDAYGNYAFLVKEKGSFNSLIIFLNFFINNELFEESTLNPKKYKNDLKKNEIQ